MDDKKIILSVKNLSTEFKEKNETKKVHKDLSFDVFEGETLAIIGANGAGKTVLVETIVGVREIQKGEIEFMNGFDKQLDSGIQFQVEDNISELIRPKYLIEFYKDFYGKEKINEKELNEIIKLFQIEDFLNKKMKSLSGGQRQRINLLLAIMAKPKLLILDEFTTGLDITTVINILDYIIKITKENNITTIIVTHSAKEIKMLADRVVLIQDGIIKDENTTKSIDMKYKGDFDQFLIDQIRGVK